MKIKIDSSSTKRELKNYIEICRKRKYYYRQRNILMDIKSNRAKFFLYEKTKQCEK